MIQALLAGVASIKAQQTAMNVIGDDLANINTTAYKGSRVTFQDMIAQQTQGATAPSGNLGGTNPVQFGLGVQVAGTDTDNQQGSLSATNRPTDLAIQGNGYFMVGNGQAVSYTRDGSFSLDANGNLVSGATGQRLLGWSANALGIIDTSQPVSASGTLNIPVGRLNAVQATTQVSIGGNLSSSALPTDTATMQVQVYDPLGAAHDVTIQYTNRQSPPVASPAPPAGAVSSWDWTAYLGDTTSGTAIGSSTTSGNTPVYFDNNGKELSGLPAGALNMISVPGSGSGSATNIGLDMSGLGQLGTDSQVSATNQNGFPPGSLQNFSIGSDGVITGLFTNGLTRSLGQVALAVFPNPGGLARLGQDLWQGTADSGLPNVGTSSSGGRGSINSGFLEQSNVDISTEFTNLIVTQRGFQANTKVVSTVDQMLQDLIAMKQ